MARRSAIFLALLGMVLSDGCAGGKNASERMMWSTYPLVTKTGAATGFIVNRRNPQAPGGIEPVMITSLHALESMGDGPLFIGSRLPDATESGEVAFIMCSPGKARDKERFYVRHPVHDVAAFPVLLPTEFKEFAGVPSFLDDSMLVQPGRQARTGVEVSFLGYPSVLPGTDGAFPVLRSGRVASYPVGSALSRGCFLINSDVYPGDSGAPVFLAGAAGSPRLAGMIIQRIGNGDGESSHLAVAVDSTMIRETLDLLQAREALESPKSKPAPPARWWGKH